MTSVTKWLTTIHGYLIVIYRVVHLEFKLVYEGQINILQQTHAQQKVKGKQ